MPVLKDDHYYRGFRDRRGLSKFKPQLACGDGATADAYKSYREGFADGMLSKFDANRRDDDDPTPAQTA